MSADRSHGAIDLGFLGHLVERTQPQATPMRTPILERRRPGIFEPRAPVAAAALDIEETTVEPRVSSLTRAAAPAMQAPSYAPQAPTSDTPSPMLKTTARAVAENVAAPAPRIAAPSSSAHTTQPPSLPVKTRKFRDTADAATRNSQSNVARETPAKRHPATAPRQIDSTSPMAPLRPKIVAPPTMTTRSEKIVRVEHSKLESRTTIIEREIDKHRDPSTSAAHAPMLVAPPRLANSEAQKAPVAHPVRSAAMIAAPSPQSMPVPTPVQVSIGRIEIRGYAGATASVAPRSAAPKPQLGLDEYLQQRHGTGR